MARSEEMSNAERQPLMRRGEETNYYGSAIDQIVSINNDAEESQNVQTGPVSANNSSNTIEVGSLNVLSAKYESLDYDTCENHLLLDEMRSKGYRFILKKSLARWMIFLLIGVVTALIACFIDIMIEILSDVKYKNLQSYITESSEDTSTCHAPPKAIPKQRKIFIAILNRKQSKNIEI